MSTQKARNFVKRAWSYRWIFLIILSFYAAISFSIEVDKFRIASDNAHKQECEDACVKIGAEYLKNEWGSGGWFRNRIDDCYCSRNVSVMQAY